MKIKAAVTHSMGEEFKIEEVEISDPKANEVLIKVFCFWCMSYGCSCSRYRVIPISSRIWT